LLKVASGILPDDTTLLSFKFWVGKQWRMVILEE
jgi:hypothetical protein